METPKSSNQSENKLHFLDYWRIIRIRKTVILAVFLLVVLTTTAVTFILPKTYSSMVRIEVGKDNTDIAPLLVGVQHDANFDPYFIQTEFEKIKSKTVLYSVITNLNLTKRYTERLKSDVPLKVNEAYQILVRQIDVRQSRNTSLIEIRAYSDDPAEAARIANSIYEEYKDLRMEKRKIASDKSIEMLMAEEEKQLKAVRFAQEQVDKLRQEYKVADIDFGTLQSTLEPETVRRIEQNRIDAKRQYTYYHTILEKLKGKSSKQLREIIPATFPDPQLSELIGNLNKAENEYTVLVNELGAEHVKLKNVNQLISNLNTQIENRVQGVLTGLEALAASHKANVDEMEREVETAKERDAEKLKQYRPYFLAKSDLDTQKKILETIKIRVLQESVDAKLPKESIVQLIDGAEANPRPVSPNIPINIALGVVVGLIMGCGLAFFIEYLDTSVKTIDDVERALQAPVLGVIPQNVGALIDEGPDSPHAEAYRVLRTNILFSRKDPSLNTLTVVSGGAGEGKSTTIFNLATIFAQNGHRVLIVDSDLRRPSLHKILNVTNSIGLTNYLLKQNTMDEVIQTTPVPSLFFLPSGKLPSSSMGILNSTQMKEFIHKAKEKFDFVFFDSPPIMGVSDASILASEVDMAVLVIQYRKYPQAMTIRAKQMVEKVGGNLLGVVLNNINISQDSYYYYYSGYYYDYYSKHDDDEEGSSSKKNGESKKNGSSKPGDRASGVEIKQKY